MKYALIITPEAEQDMASAKVWYESARVGLGGEFLMCIDASLQSISRNPFLHQIRYREVRICFIPRFPYGIHYRIVGETIQVVALLHMHRDPRSWKL